jgi:predicted transcriptional regulator
VFVFRFQSVNRIALMNFCSTTNYLIDTARMFEYPHREFFNSSQMRRVAAIDSTKESLVAVRAERRQQMARRKSPTLTEVELELMDVLWDKGQATVSEIVESLPDSRLAYSSVLTMMRILEQKGYVEHEKEGRAFVYRPLVNRQQAQKSVIGYLLKRFFNNSPELLVVNLLEHEDVTPAEVRRLKKMIEDTK